jgi:beta-phosphoglucomutase
LGSIKACLFDLDGVIVDTAKYHYLAWKRLADQLGIPFSQLDNERLKGVSRSRSLEIVLELGGLQLSGEEQASLAERKNGWYVDYITRMDRREVLPGVREFLQRLRKSGIKIALGSASKNAMMILHKTGMADYFDAIVDGTKTTAAKPDPQVFLLAAQEVGVSAEECIVFEDAEAGLEAAKRAGMFAVGVGTPVLIKQADMVIGSFEELQGAGADKLALIFGSSGQTFA